MTEPEASVQTSNMLQELDTEIFLWDILGMKRGNRFSIKRAIVVQI